jgi:hypothetical protein
MGEANAVWNEWSAVGCWLNWFYWFNWLDQRGCLVQRDWTQPTHLTDLTNSTNSTNPTM